LRPSVALRRVLAPIAALVAAEVAGAAGAQAPPRAPPAIAREVTQVELAFDADRAVAGGTAVVRVLLRDTAGPVDAPVRVLADGGTVDEPVHSGPGTFTARVAISPVLGANRVLLVIASAGNASASATLPLVAGPTALLRVEPPTDLAADGAPHPLWITVADAHGNPSAEIPRVEALRGSVSEPVSLASGGWMLDYRPPRDTRRGEDVLRLSAGPARGATTLTLAPFVPTLSVAARGGAVLGADGPAAAFGAEAATWIAAGPLEVGLALAATWWSGERHGSARAGGGELDLRARHAWLPLTLSATLRRPLGERVLFTLSAGGGAALVTNRATLAGQPSVTEAGWAPVASAGLELALRQRVGEPFLGAHGWWVGDAGLETLRGAAWPVFLHLGYRFHAY
jgi:hypothetical protein